MNANPVIAGASALVQHTDEANRGVDAIGLMVKACQNSAPVELLAQAGVVAVPRGTWRYPDPSRLVAEAIGASQAETVVAELGVLQTSVFAYAVDAVASRRCDVAIVAGGESLDRRKVARRGGYRAEESAQSPDARPEVVLKPKGDFRGTDELRWGIDEPYVQYALMDSARRHRLGSTPTQRHRQIAELWSAFSTTASMNPSAWQRRIWSADELLDTGLRGNRSLATPYSAGVITQMHVDQAAAIVICSRDAAERAGIPASDWTYPSLIVECDLAVPLVERAEVAECPQWSLIADALTAALGKPISDVDLIDLYSCFPVAVDHQRDAFGLGHRRDVTVTGGMTFGGGPLNNAALQAMARAIELLRTGGPDDTALVTAISGYQTKQGALLLRRGEPSEPYCRTDLTYRARHSVRRRPVVTEYTGRGVIEASTVVSPRDKARELVVIVGTTRGAGTVGRTDDPQLVAAADEVDLVGRSVELQRGTLYWVSIADPAATGGAR